MVYTKPTVTGTNEAFEAIKGQAAFSKIGVLFDARSWHDLRFRVTAAAYEADE
jgi:hypothetical protein